MGYIGQQTPRKVTAERYSIVATAGQTLISNVDYTVGYVDVYRNGLKQVEGVDFTADTGNTVTFLTALVVDDDVEVLAYNTFEISNTVSPADLNTAIAGIDLSDLSPTELTLPVSASDPASPSEGDIYYNSTDSIVKSYDGTQWVQLSNKFSATGGTVSTDGTYKYHAFTSSGTFDADSSGVVDILIAAGGAGGGYDVGGGGGAGGLVYASGVTLGAGSYSVVVGAGGAGSNNISSGYTQNQSGSNSSFPNQTTAIGGGKGGPYVGAGTSGGSGGGGGGNGGSGASGTTGQGYAGSNGVSSTSPYSAGGGGGAGGAASGYATNGGGHGGIGADYSTWATATNTGESGRYCGGGGGGGGYDGGSGGGGVGGTGGGGNGHQRSSTTPAESGQANTGGGGGGTGSWSTSGPATGNGGSGIVIIRYLL